MDAALRADILAEQDNPFVDRHFVVEGSPDRCHHIDPLAVALRRLGCLRRSVTGTVLAAHHLHLALEEDIAGNRFRIGDRSGLGLDAGLFGGRLGSAGDRFPFLLAQDGRHQIILEPRQRIARPLASDEFFALVGLGILEAVSFEAWHFQPQQNRHPLVPHQVDGALRQPGRLLRI